MITRRQAITSTLFGTGYVGLVTGAGLADLGMNVICVDKDKAKIDALGRGVIPIYEPGLEELVSRNERKGRLRFTTDLKAGIESSVAIFIAVGTPPNPDGSPQWYRLPALPAGPGLRYS